MKHVGCDICSVKVFETVCNMVGTAQNHLNRAGSCLKRFEAVLKIILNTLKLLEKCLKLLVKSFERCFQHFEAYWEFVARCGNRFNGICPFVFETSIVCSNKNSSS